MSDSETVVEPFARLGGRAAARGFRSVFDLSGVGIELILSNRRVRMEELSQITDQKLQKVCPIQSYLSATIGSTLEARRAGRKPASADTAIITAVAAAIVSMWMF